MGRHSGMRTKFFVVAALTFGLSSLAHAKGTPNAVPGEYIVKLKSMSSPAGVMGRSQRRLAVKASFGQMNMYHMKVQAGADETKTVADLVNDPDVEYVEPNYIFKKADLQNSNQKYDVNTPVQVYSTGQVQAMSTYSTSSTAYSQNNSATGVANSWAIESNTSNRPIVAIVDTGLDSSHSVFQQSSALWVNTREIPNNGIDDDGNGYVDDVNGWNFITNSNNFLDDDGHGTHVAGIIVGTGLNIFESPITTTAKVQIMPLKFLDSTGSGTTANAVSAIYYAVNNGAQVINNSWGGNSYSQALHEALTYAYTNHVFIASAAGNNGQNNDSTDMYPANYNVPSNMSVAATTDYDYLASFSDYGSTTVHIASPGVYITSTLPNNTFGVMSGTSMATPFIAGMAAMALREAPQLTGYQIKNLLMAQVDNIATLVGKVSTAGRVNCVNTITQAKQQTSVAAYQPAYSPVYQADRSVASVSPQQGGCGLVSTAILHGPGNNSDNDNSAGILVGLMLLPVILWVVLRQRAMDPVSRRRYERFKMSSDIRVSVGDRELVGSLRTISLGGASFSADAALEKGGIITMKIASPDGKDLIEVQGQVVWSEANQSYGVQFANTEESTLSAIQKWTQGLMKA